MYKKIILIALCIAALTQASNTAAADTSKPALQKQKSNMALDFTPLLR